MQHPYDYKRYAILYVDDEAMALKYFEKTFGAEFRVLTAESAEDGMKIIQTQGDDIGVLLSDQRMPGQKGVQLLQQALQLRPRMVRMLITAYADYGVTVDAVNLGSIFRYVSKPFQPEDMRNTLRRALDFYAVQRERDDLLMEKLSVLQKMIITDRVISLGVLAAGLSRTLRNPFEAVQAFLALAPDKSAGAEIDLDRLRDADFWKAFHAQVLDQAASIARSISEGEQGSASLLNGETEMDPTAIIQAAVSARAAGFQAKGIVLDLQLARQLPPMHIDRNRFQRMVDLLLEELLTTLPPGSRAVLNSRVAPEGAMPSSIHIGVTDNGPGLQREALRSVFDPFAIKNGATHQRGAQLLAVFLLVHHHGGRINARNLDGGGASYQIEFPVQPAAAPSAEESSREFVTRVLINDTLWERLLAEH